MKAKSYLYAILAALLLLCGCGSVKRDSSPVPAVTTTAGKAAFLETSPLPEAAADEEKMVEMKLRIGDTPVTVSWEDNESSAALRDLASREPLSIELSGYGGFEQVGYIGQSLPRDDVQMTTGAGDIVLYSGNQIVLFYGSNSWAYTRLGHITEPDGKELEDLLSQSDVNICIYVE